MTTAAEVETARRRCFARDADDADLAAWRSLAAALRDEQPDPVDRGSGSSSRLGPRLLAAAAGAGLMVAIAAGAVIAVVAPRLQTAPTPAPHVIAARDAQHAPAGAAIDTAALLPPPDEAGGAAITLVGVPVAGSTPTTAWGGPLVDPQENGLALALHCRGAGVVTVDLTSGEAFRFHCAAGERTILASSDWPHPEAFGAVVRTSGRVAWGLRIVLRPVADLRAAGGDRWHDLP